MKHIETLYIETTSKYYNLISIIERGMYDDRDIIIHDGKENRRYIAHNDYGSSSVHETASRISQIRDDIEFLFTSLQRPITEDDILLISLTNKKSDIVSDDVQYTLEFAFYKSPTFHLTLLKEKQTNNYSIRWNFVKVWTANTPNNETLSESNYRTVYYKELTPRISVSFKNGIDMIYKLRDEIYTRYKNTYDEFWESSEYLDRITTEINLI